MAFSPPKAAFSRRFSYHHAVTMPVILCFNELLSRIYLLAQVGRHFQIIVATNHPLRPGLQAMIAMYNGPGRASPEQLRTATEISGDSVSFSKFRNIGLTALLDQVIIHPR